MWKYARWACVLSGINIVWHRSVCISSRHCIETDKWRYACKFLTFLNFLGPLILTFSTDQSCISSRFLHWIYHISYFVMTALYVSPIVRNRAMSKVCSLHSGYSGVLKALNYSSGLLSELGEGQACGFNDVVLNYCPFKYMATKHDCYFESHAMKNSLPASGISFWNIQRPNMNEI